MHRPTEENKRITLGNKDAYLFRDVVYWKEFQHEHDVFTDLLRDEGIEVLMLTDQLDEHDAHIAETLPNLVFTRDVCMVSNLGAHALRMTYAARQVESLLIDMAMKNVSYEWNERLIEILDDRGFDVLTIPGSQLSIGGGGPHCMTCPILRD